MSKRARPPSHLLRQMRATEAALKELEELDSQQSDEETDGFPRGSGTASIVYDTDNEPVTCKCRNLSIGAIVACDLCSSWFHARCLGIDVDATFVCDSCKSDEEYGVNNGSDSASVYRKTITTTTTTTTRTVTVSKRGKKNTQTVEIRSSVSTGRDPRAPPKARVLDSLLRQLPGARLTGNVDQKRSNVCEWVRKWDDASLLPEHVVVLKECLGPYWFNEYVSANRPGWRVRDVAGADWNYHHLPRPANESPESLTLLLEHIDDPSLTVELCTSLGVKACPSIQTVIDVISWICAEEGEALNRHWPVGWHWSRNDFVQFVFRVLMLSNRYNNYHAAFEYIAGFANNPDAPIEQCCDRERDLLLPCSLHNELFTGTLAEWRTAGAVREPNTLRFEAYQSQSVGTGAGHRVRLPSCVALVILTLFPGGFVTKFKEGRYAGY